MSEENKKRKHDWVSLKTEYLTTNVSIRGLARKYDISYNTLNSRSNKERWADEKREVQSRITAQTQQKVVDSVVDEKVLANSRHNELFNKSGEVIDFLLGQLLEEIPRVRAGALKKGRATAHSMDFLLSAILKLQKGQRVALNIEVEDLGVSEPEVLIIGGLDIEKI